MGRVSKKSEPAAEPKVTYQPGQRPVTRGDSAGADTRASNRAAATRELDELLAHADFEERQGTPRAAANDGVREKFLELLEEVGTMTDAYEKAQADADEAKEDLKSEEASKAELQKEHDKLANDLAAAQQRIEKLERAGAALLDCLGPDDNDRPNDEDSIAARAWKKLVENPEGGV